ncbi:hypothetical protein [Streptomyces sp. NPDC002685]|uniref:hypothetical protein n=1 Tax=Streptomyces sp. NPDC002685 TaxID=3154540 RepID=UPI00331C91F5
MALTTVRLASLGPLPMVVTASFVAGVGLGYLVLSRGGPGAVRAPDWRRVPREAVLVAVAAVPVGVAVGCTTSTGLTWFQLLPSPAESAGWLGSVALAVACGVATATALAVLGVVGEPLPSYASLGRRRRVTSAVIVLLATAGAFIFPLFLLAPVWVGAVTAVTIGGLVALGLRTAPSGAGGTAPTGSSGTSRGRFRRPLLRGLTVGLLAGLCLGLSFGLADATTLSIRAAAREDFPPGTVHRLADGTRYVVTGDGWGHGLRPDGDRYLRTPKPVDVVVEEYSDGSRYVFTAESPEQAAQWDCSLGGRCTPIHGHIELHLRTPGTNLTDRLPNGAYVEDSDVQTVPPDHALNWLFAAPPGALFGSTFTLALTVGLTLGLVSGLASGFHAGLVSPADTARAVSPRAGLRTDRATVITRGVTLTAFGIGTAIVSSGALTDRVDQAQYLAITFIAWILAGPFAVFLSAWGWFLVARLWLCGTGRLPWRLMAFLDEAHQRGVLRQAGAAYEFRHALVQEQLASSARPQRTRP